MKKFYYLFLGTVVSGMVSCSDNLNDMGSNNDQESIATTVHNENQSIIVYGNLDDSFMGDTRSMENIIYPNYYAGSYIDNNGKLVILSTDNTTNVFEDLKFRTKSSYFNVEECNYSLNELMSLNERLGKIFENTEIANELKWVSVGIDITNNKVSVDLEDCSEQMINKFKTMVLDSPMIKFNEVSPIIWDSEYELIPVDSVKNSSRATVQTNVHLGSSYSSTGKKSATDATIVRFFGSVGCRAMRGTEHGFVTAAHCLPQVGMSICFGSTDTYLGKVTSVKLNGTSDAAFVAVDYNNFYPTNTTYRTKTALADKVIKNSTLVGYEVSTEGQTTTNVIKAKVTEINKKVHIQQWTPIGQVDFYANNLVYATFTSSQTQGGDSGGIVYLNGSVAGIHSGRLGTTTQIFSSAELALKDLGVTNVWVK